MSLASFINVISKMFTNHIYIYVCVCVCVCVCVYKEDLALNNLQWFICHKTKINQAKLVFYLHLH